MTQSKVPSVEQLEAWADDGVCEATDGCTVESDGYCEHGCPSWLLKLGLCAFGIMVIDTQAELRAHLADLDARCAEYERRTP